MEVRPDDTPIPHVPGIVPVKYDRDGRVEVDPSDGQRRKLRQRQSRNIIRVPLVTDRTVEAFEKVRDEEDMGCCEKSAHYVTMLGEMGISQQGFLSEDCCAHEGHLQLMVNLYKAGALKERG